VTKTPSGKAELSSLARQARGAYARTKGSRDQWIKASLELARALGKARRKFADNLSFSAWLNKAGLKDISNDDRAALIGISLNIKDARDWFKDNSDRWSWRLCWFEVAHLRSLRTRPSENAPENIAVPVTIKHQGPTVAASYEVATSAKPLVAAPVLRIVSSISPAPEKAAIAALNAIVEAAALATDRVAALSGDGDLPSPDQLREAARWLDLLADRLEEVEQPGPAPEAA